jgi:hypothetical protein
MMLITACGNSAELRPAVTSTSLPTAIPTSNTTPTPTSTPTITPTPTPIGAIEPKIAFVGKDSQGNLGIYVDGLYTGKPEKISPVTVPEENAPYLALKWSPDGTKLMFVNNNEINRKSFFLFDSKTQDIQEITRVPSGQDVFGPNWSADGKFFYFSAASRSHPQAVNYKLDLSTRGMSQTDEISSINNNSHVNSLANCNGQFPDGIRALTLGGVGGLGPNGAIYDRICFYPALAQYGGLKYNEGSTEFNLLAEDGEVQKTLVTFPPNFFLNGSIDLSLSPDKSQLLIIGEGGSDTAQAPFAFPIQLTNVPLDKSNLKLGGDNWSPLQVYGWSPDGMN